MNMGKCNDGLDGRCRDHDGEIYVINEADTKVETLRH